MKKWKESRGPGGDSGVHRGHLSFLSDLTRKAQDDLVSRFIFCGYFCITLLRVPDSQVLQQLLLLQSRVLMRFSASDDVVWKPHWLWQLCTSRARILRLTKKTGAAWESPWLLGLLKRFPKIDTSPILRSLTTQSQSKSVKVSQIANQNPYKWRFQ